jgi:hypothetical protein
MGEMRVTTYTRLLNRSLVVGEVLVLGWLFVTEDLSRIGFLLLGIAAAIGLVAMVSKNWPLGAVLVLAVSSAMPRFAGTVFGLHLRPEHVAIGLIVPAVLVYASLERPRVSFNLKVFDYFLIAYIALNFITSAATSPEPRMTLRWAAMNAIAIAPYFLLRFLVRTEHTLYKAARILLWVGAAESAYGILCFLSNHIFNTVLGMEAEQYGFVPGTYGTQYEANLFGSYSACCAIMFLTFYLLSPEPRRARYGLGFVVTTLGVLISQARAVLLAFPLAIFLVIWIALRRGQFQLRKFVLLGLAAALLALTVSPFVLDIVRERFSTIGLSGVTSDETSMVRLVSMALALQDIQKHPVLGTGTASFQILVDWDDYLPGYQETKPDAGAWIGNTPLRILHDTGVVGLVAFLFFIGYLTMAVRRVARNADGRTMAILTALFTGVVLYAITFQATEATMLAFTWVHLGLLGATVAILEERPLSLEAREAR